MTPVRVGMALLLIGLTCLSVVVLRGQGMALEARAQSHLTTLIELRRRVWDLEMEIARLRTPEQICERIERMRLPMGAAFEKTIVPEELLHSFAANDR